MANESRSPTESSLTALLSGVVNDATAVLTQEWTLAKLEVQQTLRRTQRTALAFGSGGGLAVIGGLFLLVMLVLLVAAWTELPLWGCYGLLGGALALLGGVFLIRGRVDSTASGRVPAQSGQTPQQELSRRARQLSAKRQTGPGSAPASRPAAQSGGRAPALTLSAFWALCKATFTQWSADKPFQLAAALAYYTLFSLAPLLLIAITIAGVVFGREATEQQIITTFGGLVGSQGAQAIQGLLRSASRPAAGVLGTLISIVTLLIGAGGVVGQLQDSLNTIWGVTPKPGRGLWGMLQDRFVSLGMVLGVGFLLLVSLIVSTALSAAIHFVSGALPGGEGLWHIVELVVSLGFITLLFALIYKFLPAVEIAWRDVWVGAAMTAALFTLGKFLIGLYLGHSGVSSAYGAASSLVLVLVWVYYSGLIFFFGAEFTQVYANTYGRGVKPDPDAQVVEDKTARAQDTRREG